MGILGSDYGGRRRETASGAEKVKYSTNRTMF